jgi:hypothetical protein
MLYYRRCKEYIVDLSGRICLILALAAVSGCILGEGEPPGGAGASDANATRQEEDAFIKEYLKGEAEKTVVVDVPTDTPGNRPNASAPSTTTSTQPAIPCPFECCNESGYEEKGCGRWFACRNRTCTDRPCPFECCNLGMYEDRLCRAPLECLNSTCLRPECPDEAECCPAEDYLEARNCTNGMACLDNACSAGDADGDGLADVVEINLGTNATLRDTDGDGLSDYQEARVLGTDPLSVNTDRDRYADGLDKSPARTDSAVINITYHTTVVRDEETAHALIMHLDFGQPLPDNGSRVADFDVGLGVYNTGTDYTPYVNFTYHIGYWCGPGVDPRRRPFVRRFLAPGNESLNETAIAYNVYLNTTKNSTSWDLADYNVSVNLTFDPGDRYLSLRRYTLRMRDLPNATWAAVVAERGCAYNATIRKVEYERF